MNRLIFLLVPIFLITAACGGGGGSSSSATASATPASSIILAWNAPTTNADTSTLTDLSGYKIYFGQVAGNYNDPDSPQNIACTASCECNRGAACTYTVDEALLGAGKWCFVITAYDGVSNESVYSDEACRD